MSSAIRRSRQVSLYLTGTGFCKNINFCSRILCRFHKTTPAGLPGRLFPVALIRRKRNKAASANSLIPPRRLCSTGVSPVIFPILPFTTGAAPSGSAIFPFAPASFAPQAVPAIPPPAVRIAGVPPASCHSRDGGNPSSLPTLSYHVPYICQPPAGHSCASRNPEFLLPIPASHISKGVDSPVARHVSVSTM